MTVTVRRPDQTLGSTGISVSAGSAHNALADSSDTTYVTGITNNGTVRLGIQDFTLSGLRIKQARIRVRNAHSPSGSGIQVGWAALYDPNGPGRCAQLSMSRGSTSVAEQAGPWATAGPNGQAWSQTLVNRVAVQVAFQGDSAWLRVHEVYVDLDSNSQPTTSTVAFAGATTTTRPDVSWTYADSDGDPQTRYQVKVFSAAQYGAGGFSADKSAATWDSGQLFGDDDTVTVGVDLVSGTTYRAYVRTAQDWSGPEGDLWWSAWANSSATTVVVSPPPAPTLTAAGQVELPSYRVRLTGSAPVNLLDADQADFEAGLSTWVADSNCSVAVSATNPAQGTQALQLTSSASGAMAARASAPATGEPVLGNRQYTALASFRAATAARASNVAIRWYRADATTLISTSTGTDVTSTTGGYTQASVTATAPGQAAYAVVLVTVKATAAAGEVHRVDLVDLHAGASTTWTVGGLRPTQTVTVERGDRVTTLRGPAVNWAHPQVASGGDLLRSTAGFYASAAGDVWTWEPLPVLLGAAGAGAIHWQPRSGTAGVLYLGASSAGGLDGPWQMPVVPGQSHTLSVRAWAASSFSAALAVDWLSADGTTVISSSSTGTISIGTTPARYSITGTCPSTAVYARGTVTNVASSTTNDVWVASVGFGLGAVAVDDQPGTGGDITWTTVRALDATVPVGESYATADYEIPPARPVLYRARTLAASGSATLASGYSTPVAAYLTPPSDDLLLDPWQPERAVAVTIAPSYTETRTRTQQVYRPLGRDGDPIVRTDWLGGQDASLTLAAASDADLYRLQALLLSSARALLLQRTTGGQMYVLVVDDDTTTWPAPGLPRVGVRVVACVRPA